MKDVFKKMSLDKIEFKKIEDESGNVIDLISEVTAREYMLIMNINVLAQLEEAYKTEGDDGLESWSKMIDSGDSKTKYELLSTFLSMCINEGIRIENKHRRAYNLKALEPFAKDELNLSINDMLDITGDLITTSTDTGKK